MPILNSLEFCMMIIKIESLDSVPQNILIDKSRRFSPGTSHSKSLATASI
ncbi:uncharacterized protein PHALS_08582 [Plasmopara halstedii]|uniref:Uncharacterized protein n=1 Tax=Plasmopara halstedii TaxID=4781 RepID=A0A0P1ACB3_PLAHL|nr:uncharacterized protein PHALS_08582 [Plasmopara halstedii]CEG38513.1 hypothetical protein PHALS_08582 [Plasmopara halstedii]|eukprot:XP_024574882.1 hypothetical protein PHALS_08582 [Plasmopara halstedii]